MKKTESEKLVLKAEKRNVFGKKLKKYRKEGKIPANVFGQNFKSEAIFVNIKDFKKIFQKAKTTGIVYLELEKEKLPTLIAQVQLHPVDHQILHVDFRKVDLTQKIVTEVPIKIVGKSKAVEEKGGYLLVNKEKIQIEALPEAIPPYIEIDISNLTEINQEIKVEQIKGDKKYEIKEDPQTTIVSVIEHKEEKVTQEVPTPTETPAAQPTESKPTQSSSQPQTPQEQK